jgi:phage recombination protein Bet
MSEHETTAHNEGDQEMNAPARFADNQHSVIKTMAERYGMEPGLFKDVIRRTVIPQNASLEQFAAFMLVANHYQLNPLTKEIYAFPARGGGIQPIVGIDGWVTIINRHPQFDGVDFEYAWKDDRIAAVTCRIYRKDRSRPTVVTEYMNECKMPTDAWNMRPVRMLRHKALMQCARYAFSISGLMDEEEGETIRDITPPKVEPKPAKIRTLEDFGNGGGKPEPKKPARSRGRPKKPEPEPEMEPEWLANFREDLDQCETADEVSDSWNAITDDFTVASDELKALASDLYNSHMGRVNPEPESYA